MSINYNVEVTLSQSPMGFEISCAVKVFKVAQPGVGCVQVLGSKNQTQCHWNGQGDFDKQQSLEWLFVAVQAKSEDSPVGDPHAEGEGVLRPWWRGTMPRVSPVYGSLSMGVDWNL